MASQSWWTRTWRMRRASMRSRTARRSDRTMIAFGGAAPLHVSRVARSWASRASWCPPAPASAPRSGFLLAPVSYEVARSHYARLRGFAPERLNALLAAMTKEARQVVALGGPGRDPSRAAHRFRRAMSARARDCGHRACRASSTPRDAETLRRAFESAYLAQYGRLIEGIDIEILTWTVTVRTETKDHEPLTNAPIKTRIRRRLAGGIRRRRGTPAAQPPRPPRGA